MKPSETALLHKFNQVLESNFHKSDFGIDEICAELGTSRSQLYRVIKEQTQLSISLYIRQRKLIKAKELLKSDRKTAEIAYLLGIDSPQNFSKYFAKEFGITPTAYRKQLFGGKEDVLEAENHPDEEINDAVEASALLPSVEKKAATLSAKKYLYAGIGLILVFLTLLFIWKPFQTKTDEVTLPAFSGNSIAIMPFKNLGNSDAIYFCEGIMQQIHGSLSLINDLKVISTTSSGKYKNSPKLAPQIARELDVNYLLEGSVFQSENKIRINLELVQAGDDRVVWTKSYDGDTKDVFNYLTTVSKEVAGELDQQLTNALEKRLGKNPMVNPEAYHEYLKGSHLIVYRKKEQLEEGIIRLKKAIALDPNFAEAYSKIGLAYYLLGESAFMDEQESFRKTEENSLTAIRLDSENALAYANLANIYRAQHKWEQAKTAYQIALKYSPNDALINYWFSLLLTSTGNLKEAMRYNAKAVALDPLYHVIFAGNIYTYVCAGELEMAKKLVVDGKVLFNDSWIYHWHSGSYYGAKKDYKMALKCYDRANQLNPGIRSVEYQTMYYKALDGQTEAVNEYLTKLPDLPVNYISRSVVYAGLKDKKQSLYYFLKAADLGIIQTNIRVAPYLAILRDDPRFETTLAKFGL